MWLQSIHMSIYDYRYDSMYWLGLTLCIMGAFVFFQHPLLALVLCAGWGWRCVLMRSLCFVYILFRHWCCVLVGFDAVYYWEPLLFFNSLSWHWCCVLVGVDAVYYWGFFLWTSSLTACTKWSLCLFLFTSSFGTAAVYWLKLTLCTGESLCFCFVNILCWHWCCVLVVLDAVY